MPRRDAPLRWLTVVLSVAAAALALVVIAGKSESGKISAVRYRQAVVFDRAYWDGQVRLSLSEPLAASIHVTSDRYGSLYVQLPALQFALERNGSAVEGYLFTLPNSTLRERPADLLGRVIPAPCLSDLQCYAYWVRPDGSITLQSRDGGPLPALPGGHRVPATTILFRPNDGDSAVINFRLSSNQTDLLGSVADKGGFDYLDYYAMDAAGNGSSVRMAFIWPDNSGNAPRSNMNVAFRRADVDPSSGAIVWGPASLALSTSDLVFCSESKVAIDPNDSERIAVAATCNDAHYAPLTTGWQWTAVTVSEDGGASWSAPVQPWALSSLPFDPWIEIDRHGNCYVGSGVVLEPGNWYAAGALSIMLSVDGCRNFGAELLSLPTADLAGGGYMDSAKFAVGPGALWFSGDDAQYTVPQMVPTIGYVPVTGLGQFGAPAWVNSFDNIPTGDCGIGLSDILVNSDTGAVYWLSTNICDGSGRSDSQGDATRISLWVAPNGTAGFGPASFLPRRDIQWNNMGISPGGEITTRRTPWAPNRGVGPKGVRALSYGAGRLYYAGLDMRPALSNRTCVTLAYSDNEGQTWSCGITANNDNEVFVGMPSIATAGSVTGAVWLDPRRGRGIAPYAAVLRASDFDR